MTDIDDQVAAFRRELEDEDYSRDVANLTEAILAAPTHQRATFLVQEFHKARNENSNYVAGVVVGMVSQVATVACFEGEPEDAAQHLVKLQAIAHTARRLGLRASRIIPKVGD